MKLLNITSIMLVTLSVLMTGSIVSADDATLKVTGTQALDPKKVQRPEQGQYKRLRPAQNTAKARYVVVKSGDTLSKIAQRNNVTLVHVQNLNKLHGKKANYIKVGQRIRIR